MRAVVVMLRWSCVVCLSACLPVASVPSDCGPNDDCGLPADGDTCDDTSNCIVGVLCGAGGECDEGTVCFDGNCVPDEEDECGEAGGCPVSCESDERCEPFEECVEGMCTRASSGVEACEAYCENIFGACVRATCDGLDAEDRSNLDALYETCLDGGAAEDGSVINPCAQDYLVDRQFAEQVDQLGGEACGASAALEGVYCGSFGFGERCGCGEPEEPRCPFADDCGEGSCDAGSTQAGAVAVGESTGCGADGVCVNEQVEQGVNSVCYDLCSVNADCEGGEACEVLGFDGAVALARCVPACSTNDDCNTYTRAEDPDRRLESFCNTQRWCEVPCALGEADSCGASGRFACAAREEFNVGTGFEGSCALAE